VFGKYFVRVPLKKSPTIRCDNALRVEWKEILPAEKCSFVLGTPPFGGKQFGSAEQKVDMAIVCGKVKGGGVLDYVAAWYFKAGDYIQNTPIRVGFVSTNSISQGEQVGILWNELFKQYHLRSTSHTGLSRGKAKRGARRMFTSSLSVLAHAT
jgi:type II restriction/modification system DNA methylase subunit YeeA